MNLTLSAASVCSQVNIVVINYLKWVPEQHIRTFMTDTGRNSVTLWPLTLLWPSLRVSVAKVPVSYLELLYLDADTMANKTQAQDPENCCWIASVHSACSQVSPPARAWTPPWPLCGAASALKRDWAAVGPSNVGFDCVSCCSSSYKIRVLCEFDTEGAGVRLCWNWEECNLLSYQQTAICMARMWQRYTKMCRTMTTFLENIGLLFTNAVAIQGLLDGPLGQGSVSQVH